jgi:CheY-like chemotaxis protein
MASHHLRVLVVDPVEDAADSLGLLLNRWGCDVQVAYNGVEGLKIAGYHHPHVVLMEVALPDVDVAEVAARLRERSILIGMTGEVDDERLATEMGCRAVVTKPLTPESLRMLLDGIATQIMTGDAGKIGV